MTERSFVIRREPAWQEFSKLVTGKRKELKKGSVSFIHMFREITQDLNTAKACGFDPVIIERLNNLVNEGNQILYKQHTWPVKAPVNFLLNTFPQKVRSQWRGILAVTLLFYGLAGFFGFLCLRFPDISKEIFSEEYLSQLEKMYNPENSYYLKPRDVTGDADMFGFYIYNNISIAFQTFASGIIAGVGSILIICFNGGLFGIIFGHLYNVGFADNLFAFVIAHGSFELTAIVFSGYAGLLMGYRFFVTKGLSRTASLKKAGQDALPIMAGSTIMLVIAAAIEAFWSSRHEFPFELRIVVGTGLWILLLFYFLFAGRKTFSEKKGTSGAVK
jgi:uncharacterized membrane protein SpoIIM required for sporulation